MLHFPFIRSLLTQTFDLGVLVNFLGKIISIFAYLRLPFLLHKYTKTSNNFSKMANTRELQQLWGRWWWPISWQHSNKGYMSTTDIVNHQHGGRHTKAITWWRGEQGPSDIQWIIRLNKIMHWIFDDLIVKQLTGVQASWPAALRWGGVCSIT